MALKDCRFFSVAFAARSEKLPKLAVRFFCPSSSRLAMLALLGVRT